MIRIIYLILLNLALNSCEEFYPLYVTNNTSNIIYYTIAEPRTFITYPDTIGIVKNNFGNIRTGRSTNNLRSKEWKEIILALPSDTLSIYFIEGQVYENEDWEDIVNEYQILKRYDLSIEDLEALDFNVPYPPTSAMSDIRQYPPYGE